MFVEIFIAMCCFLIQPTVQHFIGDFHECTASKVCNHTWTPVCGHLKVESSYRLFLDDCDLHEYNCDNNSTYVEVDAKVCGTKCTQRNNAGIPPTTPSPQVSSIISTEETITSKLTNTTKVSEPTRVKTDNSTIFVAPITLEMTEEEIKTTRQTSEMTTKSTIVKLDIETTTTIELPFKNDESDRNDGANTISEESHSPSVATTPKHKSNCYDKSCNLPSTWETTSVGETKDFVQILRERYGERIKILRDTTHFPENPMYGRKVGAFIPGFHMEGQR